jgi:hypothetical protein
MVREGKEEVQGRGFSFWVLGFRVGEGKEEVQGEFLTIQGPVWRAHHPRRRHTG